MQPLDLPPAVKTDPRSIEIARVWAAHGGQHVTLNPHLWDDPGAWGVMLVDLARHVANAYEQLDGRERAETLARIKAAFEAEWDSPTDEARGRMIG